MVAPNSGEQQNPTDASGASGTPSPQEGASGQQSPQKTVPIPALHEERDKRQAAEAQNSQLTAEIENLKNLLQEQATRATQYPQYQQPDPYQAPQMPQEDPRVKLDRLWEEDPRKAFQTEMGMAFQWRDWVDGSVDAQIEHAKSTHQDFGNYEGSVRKYVRALPLEERARPNIVEAAYFMVRGQKVDDLIKSREQQILEKIRRGESIQGFNSGTYGTPPPVQGAQITEDERRVAEAMNMPPDEYLKWRKK